MRVNRIPTALRKAKLGDLLAKYADTQSARAPRSRYVPGPPPVPAKDGTSPRPIPRKPVVAEKASPRRPHKRLRYVGGAWRSHLEVQWTDHVLARTSTPSTTRRIRLSPRLSPRGRHAAALAPPTSGPPSCPRSYHQRPRMFAYCPVVLSTPLTRWPRAVPQSPRQISSPRWWRRPRGREGRRTRGSPLGRQLPAPQPPAQP